MCKDTSNNDWLFEVLTRHLVSMVLSCSCDACNEDSIRLVLVIDSVQDCREQDARVVWCETSLTRRSRRFVQCSSAREWQHRQHSRHHSAEKEFGELDRLFEHDFTYKDRCFDRSFARCVQRNAVE
jgi:hypothetical protein